MDCIGHGVTKSQTRLNDFHFTFKQNLKNHHLPVTALEIEFNANFVEQEF